ncbi:MAG: 2-hydroxyacid dehydrogenase [Haloplanus sp.]
MKALVTANLSDDGLDRLRNDLGFEVDYHPMAEREDRYPSERVRELVADADVFVVGYEGVDGDVLDAAPDLKVVACPRGGPEANVDVGAATERGIPVLYAPGRNAVSVADFTLGLLLDATRHIAHSHHLLHTGVYTGEPRADSVSGGEREDVTWGVDKDSPYVHLKGPELDGKRLGIVGLGAIGRLVAERASGFGVEMVGHDPFVDAETMADYGVEKVDLDELCATSDFVTLHAPVTDATRGLIDAEQFERMQSSAFFVNTARAALIDQDALIDQLQSGGLRGAALDVYSEEPLPEDHPLLDMDNVVTTPHLAGAAEEVVDHHTEMVVDDIAALFEGGRPAHVANEDALDGVDIAVTR